MRLPADRREQDPDLGEPPVEGDRILRPADGLDSVPERLRLEGIVQQQRVPEVAQRATRDGMDLGLVSE